MRFVSLFLVVPRLVYSTEFHALFPLSAPQEQVSLAPPEENNQSQPEVHVSVQCACSYLMTQTDRHLLSYLLTYLSKLLPKTFARDLAVVKKNSPY